MTVVSWTTQKIGSGRIEWVRWLPASMHSARTAVAAVASLLAARLFRLPEAYWAPITTLVVTQSSPGAAPGTPREVRRAQAWAKQAIAFSRRIRFVQPALVNGAVGLVWAPRGRLFRALSFKIARRKIVAIDVIADPARLGKLDLAVLDG